MAYEDRGLAAAGQPDPASQDLVVAALQLVQDAAVQLQGRADAAQLADSDVGMAFYGDRLETLSLEKPLAARGKISLRRGVSDSSTYQAARQGTASALTQLHIWDSDAAGKQARDFRGSEYPDYVLGMLIFALTVVAYTTYGGFWAVTWTDVLQGLMIVAGAVLLVSTRVPDVVSDWSSVVHLADDGEGFAAGCRQGLRAGFDKCCM